MAFAALIEELKKTINVHAYKSVVTQLAPELGIEYASESAWLTSADKAAAQQYERLDQQLTAAKANLNKFAVRAAHFGLGDYYVARGEYTSAVKNYMRCRDDCKDSHSSYILFMRVVRAHLLSGQLGQAANYAARAERAAEALPHSDSRASFLAGVAGVAALASRNYRGAVRDFCNVRLPAAAGDAPASADAGAAAASGAMAVDADADVDDKAKPSGKTAAAAAAAAGDDAAASTTLTDTVSAEAYLPDILTGADVALYATLCALASLDRGELRRRVLDNEAFGAVLACMPAAQQLLEDFVSSRYASLFARLADLRPRMLLDSVLAPLAAELEATIRQKALKQYFGPYSVVDLSRMAAAFACDVVHLEDELAQLIADDHIQARIDSHNKRLYARQTDERADAFAAVINAGEAYVQNMQAMLLKLNLSKNDLSVRAPLRVGAGERELPHKTARDKRRK